MPFVERSTSSIPLRLADQLSDVQKARVIERLIERYGSRRALIEELDRRKRLSMLKPDFRINQKDTKGNNPKVQNAPNPQWREISTPSLLIEGERVVDFRTDLTPTVLAVLEDGITPSGRRTRRDQLNCKGCGCGTNDFTIGCRTCNVRRYARRKAAERKAQREGIIK